MINALRFDDNVALVTGAGGGLGRAHALELARRGATVIVNDLGGARDGTGTDTTAAQAVVAEIEGMGGTAMANAGSVTDPAAAQAMVTDAMEAYGRLDIVVNNAGILRDKSFAKMELGDFTAVMDVHLMGAVNVTKAAWPHMKANGYGRVVMTTSSSGLYGNFGQSNYGAAKMALVGLVNCLKQEGAKDNIRVNALSPTAWSRMTSDLFPAGADVTFAPEKVTPGLIPLVAADAPTGMILEAGGGFFAAIEVREAMGIALGGDATAEDVLENWSKITDMSATRGFPAGPAFIMALSQEIAGA